MLNIRWTAFNDPIIPVGFPKASPPALGGVRLRLTLFVRGTPAVLRARSFGLSDSPGARR